jgi:hypothetical protein
MRPVLVLALSATTAGYTCVARFGDPIGPSIDGHDGDTPCVGALSGSFDDVTVPLGASCTLQHSTVRGNLRALADAQLYVLGTLVHGNIQGDGARVVQVAGGQVDGDIQIVAGTSPGALGAAVTGGTVVTGGNIQIQQMRTGRILIADAHVNTGNIQVTDNVVGHRLEILRNFSGANLQVFENTGAGQKTVAGNTVAQSLQCQGNDPPFTGLANTARDAEGQCRDAIALSTPPVRP